MIKVNGRTMEWTEGMTVETILRICNYTFPMLIVTVNDKLVPKEEYASTVIDDGDDVQVIHLMSGG